MLVSLSLVEASSSGDLPRRSVTLAIDGAEVLAGVAAAGVAARGVRAAQRSVDDHARDARLFEARLELRAHDEQRGAGGADADLGVEAAPEAPFWAKLLKGAPGSTLDLFVLSTRRPARLYISILCSSAGYEATVRAHASRSRKAGWKCSKPGLTMTSTESAPAATVRW